MKKPANGAEPPRAFVVELFNMSGEPQLKLAWIQQEGRHEPEPCLQFETFDKIRGTNNNYNATFQVCARPRCPCCCVCVYCQPLESNTAMTPPGEMRKFWFDVWEKSLEVTPALKADPETWHLAEAIRARLAEEAWTELYRWFLKEKLEVIQTSKVTEMDSTDLPNADGGRMVGFVEVFPFGLALNVPFANGVWAVDEQYCVQPECRCTESILSFIDGREKTGKRMDSHRSVPALRYDYRSQTWREVAQGPSGAPATNQLLTALKAAHPSLDKELELRHKMLQCLYLKAANSELHSQLNSLVAPARRAEPKAGRNNPCPCGSGKKFKKCCGR